MSEAGSSVKKNSTSVLLLGMVKAGLALQFRVAPRSAEARAARLFCTPQRRGQGREPKLPGLPVTRQVRRVDGNAIVSWSWGEGPEVLLVHGWEGRASQLETIGSRLFSSGFKVTMVELPAHGASGGRVTTVMGFANAIRAVAEERGGVHSVVAHSLGATATAIALVDRVFAQRAVLLAPAVEPGFFVRQAATMLGVPERHLFGMAREIEKRAGRTIAELDLRRRAGALEVPLLVVHDEGDREVPLDHGEAVAKVSTRGVLERTSGLGHRKVLRSEAVVERIAEFVGPADVAIERQVR